MASRSPDLSRRGLIIGAAVTLIAAPAIVRAASLMPVRALPRELLVGDLLSYEVRRWIVCGMDAFGNAVTETIQWSEPQSAKSFSYITSVTGG